ncbi:MAG: DUF1330 domain-containing protein [Rhizobiaceae bacterium]
MAKGYWIGHVDISDMEEYKKYVAGNAKAFAKYGGRFLARGGQFENPEGSCRSRHVIIEFDSYQQALDCYNSEEYQSVIPIRARESVSVGDFIILEGYEG